MRLVALVAIAVVAGCASPAPTPTPGLAHFDDGTTMSFDYPANWGPLTVRPFSTQITVIVYLSTQQLSAPCHSVPGGMDCGSPIGRLAEDSLLVTWSAVSFLVPAGQPLALGDRPITVGGRRAGYSQVAVDDACASTGADVAVKVRTQEWMPDNWNEMTACLRGPDLDPMLQQIDAMLDSVEWHQAST